MICFKELLIMTNNNLQELIAPASSFSYMMHMKVWDDYQKIIVTKLLIGLAFNHTNFPPSYLMSKRLLQDPWEDCPLIQEPPGLGPHLKQRHCSPFLLPKQNHWSKNNNKKVADRKLGFAQILHTRLSTSLKNLLPIFFSIAIDPLVLNLCGIQGGIGYIALHCSGWGQQFEGRRWPRWWKRK